MDWSAGAAFLCNRSDGSWRPDGAREWPNRVFRTYRPDRLDRSRGYDRTYWLDRPYRSDWPCRIGRRRRRSDGTDGADRFRNWRR